MRFAVLTERGIKYREVALTAEGQPDLTAIRASISSQTKLVLVQRSRGYSLRPSLGINDLEVLVNAIRIANPKTIIFVDNCYGEFTDLREPNQVGADHIAGSLIKNPGGGLVPSGGYIAGRIMF
jgi:cystathionine beta-lyase family protein involved in aluminum resistance